MDQILVFTYYWPPSGGSAVQRWLALSELLPPHGIVPIIITVDPAYASYVLTDNSLEERVPKGLTVIKTKSFEILNVYQKLRGKNKLPTGGFANQAQPTFLQKVERWIRGNFFFPDPRRAWNPHALRAARPLLRSGQIKAIVTAGPPHSTHLMGLRIKKEYPKLFWLCDFHDAWTNVWYYAELMRTKPVRWLDARMELKVLTHSDAIITVGQRLLEDFGQKLGQKLGHGQKISLHTMGYDELSFASQGTVPHHAFVITYTGILAANYRPGSLFLAVAKILMKHPDWKIELHFYGLIAQEVQVQLEELGLGLASRFHGYVPHSQSISALLSSCALLLISPDIPHADMIIPGKIYEYLASGRPIIHLGGPDSDSAKILDTCGAGTTFTRLQTDALASHLEELYLKWLQNPGDLIRKNKSHIRYGRNTEAKQLAGLIRSRLV